MEKLMRFALYAHAMPCVPTVAQVTDKFGVTHDTALRWIRVYLQGIKNLELPPKAKRNKPCKP